MNEIEKQIRLARLSEDEKREMAEMLRTKQIKTVDEYLEILDAIHEQIDRDTLEQKISVKQDRVIEKLETFIEKAEEIQEQEWQVNEDLAPIFRDLAHVLLRMHNEKICHFQFDIYLDENGDFVYTFKPIETQEQTVARLRKLEEKNNETESNT